MKKEQKEEAVALLRDELSRAASVVVATSAGIPVNVVNDLRVGLRSEAVTYRVVKNTLAKRAIAGTDMEGLGVHLRGPVALAYAEEDPAVPARVLLDFRKKNEKLQVVGGYINGMVLDADGVEALSKMPSKDELRAKLLSVFNGVGTKFVRTLAAAPQQFLTVLTARKDSL
jgi:large subunit ribosomal protein L10